MKASTKKTAAVLLTLAMLFAIAACGNTAKNRTKTLVRFPHCT